MAQLITPQEVIDRAFTNQADIALIKDSFIEIAQEEHIRPVLAGDLDDADSLYFDIVDQNNQCTLTVENETLLKDYIRPCLAFYVKYEILVDMMVNTTSQGLMVNTTENSNSATDEQRASLAKKALSHANTLRDKMVRYIEDDARNNNYAKYEAGRNKSNQTNIVGGMILDSRKSKNNRSNDPYQP